MIEYTDEQHDSLIRGHRKQLADAQAMVEALRAQLTALRELVGQWAWNTTNLLGDYRIATVADFNAEWTRRSIWLIEAVQATLPPPQAEQDQQTMYELRQQVEALQRERDEARRRVDELEAREVDVVLLRDDLDAEREKVKGLEGQYQRAYGRAANAEQAVTDLGTQLTQLKALVRVTVERWRAQTNVKEGISFRMAMKALEATLDATTPAAKGGDGE